jgi:hypothetical protein
LNWSYQPEKPRAIVKDCGLILLMSQVLAAIISNCDMITKQVTSIFPFGLIALS